MWINRSAASARFVYANSAWVSSSARLVCRHALARAPIAAWFCSSNAKSRSTASSWRPVIQSTAVGASSGSVAARARSPHAHNNNRQEPSTHLDEVAGEGTHPQQGISPRSSSGAPQPILQTAALGHGGADGVIVARAASSTNDVPAQTVNAPALTSRTGGRTALAPPSESRRLNGLGPRAPGRPFSARGTSSSASAHAA